MTSDFGGHPRGSREYGRLLAALFIAGIATFTQLWSAQGVLPQIARDLEVGPATAALTVSGTTAGLALAVLPWSWVADRIGRLAAMRIALVSASALGLLAPLAPSIELLVGVRMVEGVALGGLPAVALTYLSEEVDRRHAAVAAATYVAGTSVGGLTGRLVAAPVAELSDWRGGLAAAAAVAAVAAVVFLLLAPRARGFQPGTVRGARHIVSVVRTLSRDRVVVALWLQGALLMGALVTMYNYLGFHLEEAPFGLPPAVASLLFTAYLAGTLSSRMAGALVDRVGRRGVLLASGALVLVGALLTLAPVLAVVIVGLVALTAGFFAGHAVASGWIGARARVGRAQAASIYTLSYYAGSSAAGWLGGVLFVVGDWPAVVALVVALAGSATLAAAIAARESPAATDAAQ
ncbi:MFS transporter [Chryseoglobus sp. 28M-23]|uniref:MFS transporter n=1 Tax=Chryseoglobus sp. 28M-23 TaxID=2772253 RepID=UPI001747BA01|nr:MFS transporter [Chryseoglobus sp. 28M-23]QOD93435.1 MFS transporter [Chryseoglobus sp. 28M-23]